MSKKNSTFDQPHYMPFVVHGINFFVESGMKTLSNPVTNKCTLKKRDVGDILELPMVMTLHQLGTLL